MIKAHDIDVYNNRIEEVFIEYFENRNIDLQTEYKTIPTSVYKAGFRYVYENLFRAESDDDGISGLNKDSTNIDLTDVVLLDRLADIYLNIVETYNIKARSSMFRTMLGISESTWTSWKDPSHCEYSYYDQTGQRINQAEANSYYRIIDIKYPKDLQPFIVYMSNISESDNIDVYINNSDCSVVCVNNNDYLYSRKNAPSGREFCVRVANVKHDALTRKIELVLRESVANSLADFQVGLITLANNDTDVGLTYAKENARQIEEGKTQGYTEIAQRLGLGLPARNN